MELKPGYKQTEVGVIPEDWEIRSIGDLFSFKNGLNKGKIYFGSGSSIVNYMDVYSNPGIISKNIKGRVNVNNSELKTFDVKKGDVFFTRTSETVEEVGISSVMMDDPINTVFSGFLLRARPKNNSLNNQFKKYCFSSKFIRSKIISSSSYTTRALTNGRLLSKVLILCPPIQEQRAIATVLSDTDSLIESLEQLIAKKRLIKQGTMQELLTGKRRLPGFAQKSGYKQTEVGVIPEDWVTTSLFETTIRISRGASPRPIDNPKWFDERSNIGWVRISDLTKSNHYLKETTQRLSEAGVRSSRFVPSGSLIMSICATVGRPIETRIDVCIHDGFVVFDKPLVSKSFLYHVLVDLEPKWSTSGQTGSQMNLNTTLINNHRIPLPPTKAEQEAIATVLSDMDDEIISLEEKLSKLRQIKQGMMQELLTGRIRLV